KRIQRDAPQPGNPRSPPTRCAAWQRYRVRARAPALGGRHSHTHARVRRRMSDHDRFLVRLRGHHGHEQRRAGPVAHSGPGSIGHRLPRRWGLTTAASIWAVAAIGLAIGGGLYFAGIAWTLVILVILAGVKPPEDAYRVRNQSCNLEIKAEHGF